MRVCQDFYDAKRASPAGAIPTAWVQAIGFVRKLTRLCKK
jgi:hypothetical protein